jgi:hypothetical protein
MALAWQLWAQNGPVKGSPAAREVVIQSSKLQRMRMEPTVFPSVWDILGGKKLSKKQIKKRGRKHAQIERQLAKVKARAAIAIKSVIAEPLTKTRVKHLLLTTEQAVGRVAGAIRGKYTPLLPGRLSDLS